MKINILLFIIAISISGFASASDICADAEAQFQDAVKVYKKEGGNAFMKRILKNGPLENDTRSLSQGQVLAQIEQFLAR